MSDYILRDAIETDVLDIVLAVKQFCKEVPHPAWGRFDSNKVKDLVSSLIDSEAGFVKIVTIDEEVVGALIATATPVPINSFIFAQELMFWLDYQHLTNYWTVGLALSLREKVLNLLRQLT